MEKHFRGLFRILLKISELNSEYFSIFTLKLKSCGAVKFIQLHRHIKTYTLPIFSE